MLEIIIVEYYIYSTTTKLSREWAFSIFLVRPYYYNSALIQRMDWNDIIKELTAKNATKELEISTCI